LGFTAGRADEDVVAAMNMVEYFFLSNIFFRIMLLEINTRVGR
jgi:hypothetical protein